MALVLNEEQVMLRDSAAGFLGEKAGVAQLRQLRDSRDESGFDRSVWQEMAAMGWTGIAIDEDFGGLGYGYTGLGLILEQAGRHLSASPLESTVLMGATALVELSTPAQRAELLPPVAAGERIVSLALQETPYHAPAQTASTLTANGEGWILNGCKRLVLDAHVADSFVVIARSAGAPGDEDGLTAVVVDAAAPGVTVDRASLVDARNAGNVSFVDVALPAAAVLGSAGEAWPALERALDLINVGLAAQLLGVAVEAFERTVAYLKERRQFGQPIGSFQGLQHRAADLFAELELARSIVLRALQACDAGTDDLSVLASAAKAKLCQVAQRATQEGIQMHGGIGMTDEYEIGFFIKRARVLQHLCGDYDFHLDRFARLGGY